MNVMKIDEWREEATRRGGGNMLDCPFVCPACGHTATPRQFKDLGAEPDRAAKECIGRVHNELGTEGITVHEWGKGQPCNWAAFGLFGTLSGGQQVEFPGGKVVSAFSFAEVS
jgi:hypothetical protein